MLQRKTAGVMRSNGNQ